VITGSVHRDRSGDGFDMDVRAGPCTLALSPRGGLSQQAYRVGCGCADLPGQALSVHSAAHLFADLSGQTQ
jgi:hypothetical protein